MLNAGIFKSIADLATGAKARRDEEHKAFLAFYRELVETAPTEAVALFGTLSGVAVVTTKGEEAFGIILSATDFIWWKTHIEQKGTRFKEGPLTVQLAMLEKLSKVAEGQKLTPDERKALLALLDQAPA